VRWRRRLLEKNNERKGHAAWNAEINGSFRFASRHFKRVENIGRYYIHIDHVTLALLGKQLGIFFFLEIYTITFTKSSPTTTSTEETHTYTQHTHTLKWKGKAIWWVKNSKDFEPREEKWMKAEYRQIIYHWTRSGVL